MAECKASIISTILALQPRLSILKPNFYFFVLGNEVVMELVPFNSPLLAAASYSAVHGRFWVWVGGGQNALKPGKGEESEVAPKCVGIGAGASRDCGHEPPKRVFVLCASSLPRSRDNLSLPCPSGDGKDQDRRCLSKLFVLEALQAWNAAQEKFPNREICRLQGPEGRPGLGLFRAAAGTRG